MADFNVTGLQVFDGLTAPPTLHVDAADFEWLGDHHRFAFLTDVAPLLHRLATTPAMSLELQYDRRFPEAKMGAGTNVSVPTTVAVAQDFLPPCPAPPPRNPFVEEPAPS